MGATPERVQGALDGLWKKFEEQERELDTALKDTTRLKKELANAEALETALLAQRDQRDLDIERFRTRIFESERRIGSRRDEIDLTQRYLEEDGMAMEAALESVASLRSELGLALEEIRVRDYWFEANKSLLALVPDIIKNRQASIEGSRLGPVEFEMLGPDLGTLLSKACVPGSAATRISAKVQEAPKDILGLSETALSGRFGLERADAMLLRRGLDRYAFGPLCPDVSVIEPRSAGRSLSFAVWQEPDWKLAGVLVTPTPSPEDEWELRRLCQSFYPAVSGILDRHVLGVDRVRSLTLHRADIGSKVVVLDNREMLHDNNFLLAIWRAKTRGISLVPGLVKSDGQEGSPADLTTDPLYTDISSRLDMGPLELTRRLMDMGLEASVDEVSLSSHPLTGLLLGVACSYLLQVPRLRFSVQEVLVGPAVDVGKVFQAL